VKVRRPLLIVGLLWAIPLSLPAFTRHRLARGVFVASGTLFTLFVVPGVYMLIGADHSAHTQAEAADLSSASL